jgi:hypothetical protein
MSLVTLKDGVLAADCSVVTPREKGFNMSAKVDKVHVSECGRVAFAGVGMTIGKEFASILGEIIVDDILQSEGPRRPTVKSLHDKFFTSNTPATDFTVFVVTKDGAWVLCHAEYTLLNTETPNAIGTGHWAAIVYMGEGFSAEGAIERVSRIDHTVSEDRSYIKQRSLKKMKYLGVSA